VVRVCGSFGHTGPLLALASSILVPISSLFPTPAATATATAAATATTGTDTACALRG